MTKNIISAAADIIQLAYFTNTDRMKAEGVAKALYDEGLLVGAPVMEALKDLASRANAHLAKALDGR